MVSAMIGRIREYARAHGVRATAVQLLTRLRRGVRSEERITLLLKDLESVAEPAKRSGVAIEPLDRDGLKGLSELNRRRGRRGVDRRFRRSLERGMRGFAGVRDGEVVGYYWWIEAERAAAHPDLAWLGPALRLEPGDVYGSDFYVLPDQRQGGTANELLFLIESSFRDRGARRIWGYVSSGNRQARWLYSSRGYLPMGDVTVRKLLSHRRTVPPPQVGSPAHE
jgi:ribosomal protein S18 acetylase RimI-like enzyme